MKSKFDVVVGVDQTGARVGSNGVKPLPASVAIKIGKSWKLISPLYLKSFNRDEIEALLIELGIKFEWSSVLIVVDCVLGLPGKIIKNKNPLSYLRHLMSKAYEFKGIGLLAGERFFSQMIVESNDLESDDLLRKQEKVLKCLSVFKNKPYQRNVQTGTYRIWSDLGANKNYLQFNIWPYEKSLEKAYLCEGYPAHARAAIMSLKRPPLVNMELYDEVSKDHKDAAALAVMGFMHFDDQIEIKYLKEGCILIESEHLKDHSK